MRPPKFLGVFSKNSPSAKKAGALSSGPFYFVWQLDNGSYAVQPLDKAFIATGPPVGVSAKRLRAGWRLEPGILAAPVTTPDFRHLALEQPPRKVAELTDATLASLERARKAKQVENDLRTNFDKALRALNRPRDRKGALAAIERLASATEGIEPVHKHMFRDFGVSLRKKSLHPQALKCARRVLELAPGDDHAHFNVARLLDLMGMRDEALAHLRQAMKIDSREPVYAKFKAYIEGGSHNRSKN